MRGTSIFGRRRTALVAWRLLRRSYADYGRQTVLPFLTFEYIDITGDKDILNSVQKYLVSQPLEPNAESRLESPDRSRIGESLLSHIKRAIDSALVFGKDGLLLIGGGDWNDALNEIGMQRKGESVWLSMLPSMY